MREVMRTAVAMGSLALMALLGGIGCSDESTESTDDSYVAAFTVENGDKFVVSAAPNRIVLRKNVGVVAFPFDEKSLTGKALLIHPVETRAQDGVYARATSVRSEKDQYVIDATPLTLVEMGEITEDEIVRIYMDAKRSTPSKDLPAEVLKPEAWDFSGGVHPTAFSVAGVGFNGFALSGIDFSTPFSVSPGVSITHKVETASLRPEVMATWSKDAGLELGFRADMEWKSKLTLSGRLGGEFFKSKTVESPPMAIFVPIGPVPVPVTLRGKAFVACSASASGLADLNMTVTASAKFGGSLRVLPSTGAPSSWVSQGSWPAEGKGKIDAETTFDSKAAAAVSCALPRVEVHAAVAGIAGPYLAVTPSATYKTDGGASVAVSVAAGVAAGALGVSTGVEVGLYTWNP
jgi:hypothetical protein